MPHYGQDVKSDIFLAPHHGSLTFFDDPSSPRYYYVEHIKTTSPAMTLISVGSNVHSLPDKKAVELYGKYSKGSDKDNKVFTTEDKGNMRLVLESGKWTLYSND